MMKKFVLAVSAAVFAAVGTASYATTLDFIGYTQNVSGEQAVEASPTLNPLYDPTYVPISTTAFGYSGDAASGITSDAPYAYLDGNYAGLGVCKVLTATRQCDPASDDNLTAGEVLGLTWDVDLYLTSVSFRGEGHPNDPSFDAWDLFDLSLDGGLSWLTGLQLINAKDGTFDLGGFFLEAGTQILFAFNNEQYYVSAMTVSTTIPVPAAGFLLLGGLGGLVALRRRKTA